MNKYLAAKQRNAAACNHNFSHHLFLGSRSTQRSSNMRKLVAAATALSLLALSPIAASAQSTKPAAGSTAPAPTAPTPGPALTAKTTPNTSVVKSAKHHYAKRHHQRHFAKRHRLHRLAAYKIRTHHAAKRQHHARHHRLHAKRVASKS
jgi:hypothetical protein